MEPQTTDLSQQQIVDFMLGEYTMLREERKTALSEGNGHVNLFLAVTSGTAVSLGLIAQLAGTGDTFYLFSSVLLTAIFLLGITAFMRLLEAQMLARTYIRGMNRIRRYFVDQSAELQPYLILPVYDNVPSYGSIGYFGGLPATFISMPGIIAAIDSLVLGVLAGLLTTSWLAATLTHSIIVSVAVCIVMFSVFQAYYARRIKSIESRVPVNFPRK